MTTHLTDDEVQQYVADANAGNPEAIEHIAVCELCQSKVAAYQLLFAGIQQQPEALFDFDLEKMVLAQLPQRKPAFAGNLFIYLIIFSGIILIGSGLYIFRDYAKSLFAGIGTLSIYLMVTTGIIILVATSMDMYKNYQKKISMLDI
jgi:hypothetical protein